MSRFQDRAVPGIELDGVGKKYGDRYAIRGISLSVAQGEFLSIVGPSGCGKTTILRLVAGFIRPDEGVVRIGGSDMDGVPPNRRRVGIVFQNYALFPNMTLSENVAFGMKAQKRPEPEIRRRVAELLEMVGMADRAGALPRQLSGGQQQRIALARALAIEPRVLLLDEPLSALDAKVRNSLRFEIKRIQRESGITMLYVTHDQEEALSISDRVGLMNRGKLEQVGTPLELYSAPSSLFAADFIGVNNILRGTWDGAGGFTWNGRVLRAGGDVPAGPATLTIRPEHLSPTDGDGAGDNVLEGVVQGKIFLGPVTRVACGVGDQTLLMDLLSADGERLGAGQALRVRFPAAEARLLPDAAL
ncbi:MAG: ABC transporter ATP-binding protein [Fretibacterium sp.]|nr:ABC transporter ATP-binding protein [Fretibacterium sp.]